MYYISKETFSKLSPELQKSAISDTEAYKSGEMEETDEMQGDEEKSELDHYNDDEKAEEDKNSIKDFDTAQEKGLTAIMVALSPKKAKKPMTENSESDQTMDEQSEDE